MSQLRAAVYYRLHLPDIAIFFRRKFVPSDSTLPALSSDGMKYVSIISPACLGDLSRSLASVLCRLRAQHLRCMHQHRKFNKQSFFFSILIVRQYQSTLAEAFEFIPEIGCTYELRYEWP